MKTQSLRRPNGFTLVELLVVIAIIAVLAGAGFAAGNAAIQKAKKTTALAACTGIESAINNFYTEYGAMPTAATADETIDTIKDATSVTLSALLGLETSNAPLNTRQIKFLSVKEGKNKMNGVVYKDTSGKTISGIYDPWGGSYKVIMDADYDERVKPAPKAGGTPVQLNGRRAAAWSDGADGKTTGTNGKSTDDVKTW